MPEFSSLAEIMDRFNTIPYNQFQKELNEWFFSNLADYQGTSEKQNSETSYIGNLPALVSEIYHRAELLTALSEAKITTGNESK